MFGSRSPVGLIIRKIERFANHDLPPFGPYATRQSVALRSELAALLDAVPTSSERAAAYRALGYLEALEQLDSGDHAAAVLGLAPIAIGRHLESGWGERTGTPDQLLSNSYFLLGIAYMPFAQWELCAEFFYYATFTGKNRELIRNSGMLALICSAHQPGDIYDSFRNQLSEIDPLVDFAIATLEATRGRGALSVDAAAFEPLWKLGTLPAVLLFELVTRALSASGRHRTALAVSQNAVRRIRVERNSDHLRAAMLQSSAVARLGLEDYDNAIAEAEQSWELCESLRYGNCSQENRASAWSRFLPARLVALKCAVRLGDAELVAAYIQKDRLRASLLTSLEAVEQTPPGGAPVGVTDVEEVRDKSTGSATVPGALLYALGDVWDSTRLIPPDVSSASVANMEVPWWFGVARYGTELFWSVVRHGVGYDCGSSDLLGSNLGDLLLDLESDITGRSRPDGREIGFDLFYHLAEWGTSEERIISEVLGELVPPVLERALRAVGPGGALPLVIAAGAGLDGVPWPILQIGKPDSGGFRLIERASIRHWLSDDVDAVRSRFSPSGAPLKLLIAIDDPDGGLAGRSELLPKRAVRYFSGHTPPLDDPKAEIMTALYEQCEDGAEGIFFYRGHAHSRQDPAKVCISVPRPRSVDPNGDELVIAAGEFFGRYGDSTRFLPLPSRVILSCCSSSSGSLFGGEAVGLAAACIVGGGAREVVATGRDVLDCSFTSAFDDLLAEAMTDPAPHDEVLRRLQIRMYDEWRTFSIRGGIDVTEDIRFPHPLIWAMYQAI